MSRPPKPARDIEEEGEPDWSLYGWGVGNCDPARLNPAAYRGGRPLPECEPSAGKGEGGDMEDEGSVTASDQQGAAKASTHGDLRRR